MIIVKCKTCGLDLVEKWFTEGLGELPRPHHDPEVVCPKEDPDWSTEQLLPNMLNYSQPMVTKGRVAFLASYTKGWPRLVTRAAMTLVPAAIAVEVFRETGSWLGLIFLGPLIFEIFRMGMLDRRGKP